MKITTQGNRFVDQLGRTAHLRGVNLGGSSKVPAEPDGATWRADSLADGRAVSFVGRPFPLAEADEHFGRLRRWGLTCLRFLVTWEAIEHAGPGHYDEAYLDYLYEVVKRAAAFDLTIFVDPHQDAWSRFSGGDGAPGWTFEAVGMDPAKFHETGAAVTHQALGREYPRMIWPGNYGKFACATMWTLFFGGDLFAPQSRVEGIPVQRYLQDHYLSAVGQVAERLKEFDHVIGYDTLNEPSQGYIGYPDANEIAARMVAQGPSPTIYQGMLLAAGYPQRVQDRGNRPYGLGWKSQIELNPAGVSLWRPGAEPIWRQNGVWEVDQSGQPQLLRPDHFAHVDGRPVDFGRDCFAPFVQRYRQAVQAIDPAALIFVTPPPPEMAHGPIEYGPLPKQGWVHAPHWYDGLTLGFQRYLPWLGANTQGPRPRLTLGRQRKRRDFARQIGRLAAEARDHFDGAPSGPPSGPPVLIGETGIPFNLSGGAAYRSGDFSRQVAAMDDTIQALEANLVSFTLWNYTADNSNEHGDQWNGEDLSIFSRDQQAAGVGGDNIDAGGRALAAVVRPYASRVPGRPLAMVFDVQRRTFEFSFELDPAVEAPLVLFVPALQYSEGAVFEAPGGRIIYDRPAQCALYEPDPTVTIHHIRIEPPALANLF